MDEVTPGAFEQAIKKAAHNAVIVEGGASKDDGASLTGTLEREKGPTSFGVQAGIAQTTGWSVKGFFKRVWGA